MASLQFNFPKLHSRYVLDRPWRFIIKPDHMNAGFCTYFLSDGIGMGMYDGGNSSVELPADTILEISYFDDKKIIFNLIAIAGEQINIATFQLISFWVYHGELRKLYLKDLTENEDEGKREEAETENRTNEA